VIHDLRRAKEAAEMALSDDLRERVIVARAGWTIASKRRLLSS
jgi:hypothetical protein